MDEEYIESQGRLHPTQLDFSRPMWAEYKDLKKRFKKLERKYFGLLGIRYGSKKQTVISEEDSAKINDLEHSLNVIGQFCMTHRKPHLNDRVYLLHFKIRDLKEAYR